MSKATEYIKEKFETAIRTKQITYLNLWAYGKEYGKLSDSVMIGNVNSGLRRYGNSLFYTGCNNGDNYILYAGEIEPIKVYCSPTSVPEILSMVVADLTKFLTRANIEYEDLGEGQVTIKNLTQKELAVKVREYNEQYGDTYSYIILQLKEDGFMFNDSYIC